MRSFFSFLSCDMSRRRNQARLSLSLSRPVGRRGDLTRSVPLAYHRSDRVAIVVVFRADTSTPLPGPPLCPLRRIIGTSWIYGYACAPVCANVFPAHHLREMVPTVARESHTRTRIYTAKLRQACARCSFLLQPREFTRTRKSEGPNP